MPYLDHMPYTIVRNELELHDLVLLDMAMRGKGKPMYLYTTQSLTRPTTNNIAARLYDAMSHLTDSDYVDIDTPTVIIVPLSLAYQEIAPAVSVIRDYTTDVSGTIFTTMNTALTFPRKLFQLTKLRAQPTDAGLENYVVYVSSDIAYDTLVARRILLAVMLNTHKTNASFVQRATAAIVNNTPYIFCAEELQAIQAVKETIDRNAIAERIKNITNRLFNKTDLLQNDVEVKRLDVISAYNRYIQKLEDLNRAKFNAFMASLSDDNVADEIHKYLMESRREDIVSMALRSNTLTLVIKSYMLLEDADNYIAVLKDPKRSFNGDKYPGLRQLYIAVHEGRVRIKLYARVKIKFTDNGSIEDISGMGDTDLGNVPFNEHVKHYDCFSTGKGRMRKYHADGDYIGFFEQLFTTIGSLNPYDSTVMSTQHTTMGNLPHMTPIKIRTNEGWIDSTLGDFYATI